MLPLCECLFLTKKTGTDDDLPSLNQNRILRGSSIAGNGISAVSSVWHSRTHCHMESQIHQLEQEAYASVLRAFKAQSDALTWVYIYNCFHEFVYYFCIFLL